MGWGIGFPYFIKKGRAMKRNFFLAFFLLIFTAGTVSSFAEETSSCIKCHTDEAVMKSLFLPPKIAAGSGEG
jgi:hypothetical protein